LFSQLFGALRGVIYIHAGFPVKGSDFPVFFEKNNTPIAFIKILMYIIGVVKLRG
jgi:hypothetical protein